MGVCVSERDRAMGECSLVRRGDACGGRRPLVRGDGVTRKGGTSVSGSCNSSAGGHIPGSCWSLTQLDLVCMKCSPGAEHCPGRRLCSSDYKLIISVENRRYDGMRGREKSIAKKLL